MGQCYISRRGSIGDTEPTYQYMPDMSGITAFFEPSGIDIANNVWHNAVGENDIALSNCISEDSAVKFPVGSFGTLPAPDEPEIIYIICKRSAAGTNIDSDCIICKGQTDKEHYYGLVLYSLSDRRTFEFSINGAPYVHSDIDMAQYHIIVLVRYFKFNTNSENFAMIYVDGKMAGILNETSKGKYNGNIYLNQLVEGTTITYKGTTDLDVKMIAVGSGQSTDSIVKNSEYLLKKYI